MTEKDETDYFAAPASWPWYWRYLLALGLVIFAIGAGLYFWEGSSPILLAAIIGVPVLAALIYARELGCLLVVLAFIGAAWIGSDIATDRFPIIDAWGPKIAGAAAVFFAIYWATNTGNQLTAMQKRLDHLEYLLKHKVVHSEGFERYADRTRDEIQRASKGEGPDDPDW